MFGFYTTLGPLQLQTFALALALAVVAGIGWSAYRLPYQRGAVVDAGLGALVGGVIGRCKRSSKSSCSSPLAFSSE